MHIGSEVKFSLNHVSVSLEVSGFRFNLRRAGSQESILSDLTLEKEDSSSSSSNSKSNSNSNSSSSNSLEQTLYRSLQLTHQPSSSRCFFFLFKNHAVFRIRDLVQGLDPCFYLYADLYPFLNLLRKLIFTVRTRVKWSESWSLNLGTSTLSMVFNVSCFFLRFLKPCVSLFRSPCECLTLRYFFVYGDTLNKIFARAS